MSAWVSKNRDKKIYELAKVFAPDKKGYKYVNSYTTASSSGVFGLTP